MLLLYCSLLIGWQPTHLYASGAEQILNLLGPADTLLLSGPDRRVILEKNSATPLIPASTLKLLTALVAMDTLGEKSHFNTDFYYDSKGTLKIKGFGDPLLISEVVAKMSSKISRAAAERNLRIHRLGVDDSYFVKPIHIPGSSPSIQPYDAQPGALCVNFNTVNFKVQGGLLSSAEPQTPLLPFARRFIQQNTTPTGRIILSHDHEAIALYGGHLFAHFLQENLKNPIDQVALGAVDLKTDTRLLTCRSPFSVRDAIQKMMAFSNNFVANQLLIASGAKKFGSPGNLAKAVRTLQAYCREKLQISNATLVEGSGISRANRISAQSLLRIVQAFEPHYMLLRRRGGEYFKTGTLQGISTRVGYLEHPVSGRYHFVIMANTPGRSAATIKRALAAYMLQNGYL